MLHDSKSNTMVVNSLNPAVQSAGTVNGAAVKISDCLEALVAFQLGALGGGTVALSVEESADGSTGWAAIAADRLNGTLVAGTANSVQTVGLTDLNGLTKQYVRPVVVITGGTGAGVSAVVIKSDLKTNPAGTNASPYIF